MDIPVNERDAQGLGGLLCFACARVSRFMDVKIKAGDAVSGLLQE